VDIADCRIALAAADLVAALDGDINPNLPTEAEEWLTLINRPVSNLRAKAEEVVHDILQSSPLKVYYKTNGKFPEWKQTLESLLKRLEL
jgi:predicted alternative tryptophan synthase beta-subunit